MLRMLAGYTADQVEVCPVTRGIQKSRTKTSTGMICFLTGHGSVAYVKKIIIIPVQQIRRTGC
jgi:hypothetical protein